MIVVDASLVLAAFFEDERTPPVVAAMESVGEHGAIVPSLWKLEIVNGFRMAIRRGRTGSTLRDQALIKLANLPIEIDAETNLHAWDATLRLSDRYGLTPYDAALSRTRPAAAFAAGDAGPASGRRGKSR